MLRSIIRNNNSKNVTFWWDMFGEKPPDSGAVTSRNLNKCGLYVRERDEMQGRLNAAGHFQSPFSPCNRLRRVKTHTKCI